MTISNRSGATCGALASEETDRPVVADTGPLHYLVLIGQIEILPRLFGRVTIPYRVRDELSHVEAPTIVRNWIANPPIWLKTIADEETSAFRSKTLDAGERAVLSLAVSIGASLVVMDDRAGVAEARRQGFSSIGTVGILDLAAAKGLIRLSEAFARLRATNFRYPANLMQTLPAQHGEEQLT